LKETQLTRGGTTRKVGKQKGGRKWLQQKSRSRNGRAMREDAITTSIKKTI
jgi:hypothetical protein